MNDQIINLLTTGAAIVTIFCGVNAFLGDKYIKASKKIFRLSLIILMFIFIKELTCLSHNYLVISVISTIFIFIFYVSHYNCNKKLSAKTKITIVITLFIFWLLPFQKYLISLYMPDFHILLNTYITKLNNLFKIVEVYQFMFSNQNIIYTFSCISNMIIMFLTIYILFMLNEYMEDENENQISKVFFYSMVLLLLSSGSGVFLMDIIISKFY